MTLPILVQQGLAVIRGKSENLPLFFASEKFSTFPTVARFQIFVKSKSRASLEKASDAKENTPSMHIFAAFATPAKAVLP